MFTAKIRPTARGAPCGRGGCVSSSRLIAAGSRWVLGGVVALLCLAGEARAGDVSLRAGGYTDENAFFLGIEYRTAVEGRWYAAPNFELAFPDEGSYFSANVDFHYLFTPHG